LVEYMEDHLNRWRDSTSDNNLNDMGQLTTHMSLRTYQTWSKHFDNVYLLDLHQPGDVLVHFLCNALPSAFHTCSYVQQLQLHLFGSNTSNNITDKSKMTERVSSNLFAERIVDTALQWGIINNTQTHNKKHFANRAREMLAAMYLLDYSNDDDGYWWCPSLAMQDRTHNASLFVLKSLHKMVHGSDTSKPRLLFGRNWTLAVRAHHRLFETAQQKRKLCDVNTTRVLHNVNFTWSVFGTTGIQVLRQRQQR
jgi:hypothetical protein